MFKLPSLVILLLWAISACGEEPSPSGSITNLLVIKDVKVDGKSVSLHIGHELRLGPFPENLSIIFGPAPEASWVPSRLHFKLEGFDGAWRRGLSEMLLTIRFFNESRDLIDQKTFKAQGDSTGWNGSLKGSTLTHRREILTVPPRATRFMAVVSSAGPPAAVGIYVVDDFAISRISSSNGSPRVLIRTVFDGKTEAPKDWVSDGTRPSMAKIVELGQDPKTKALAIIDTTLLDMLNGTRASKLPNALPRVNFLWLSGMNYSALEWPIPAPSRIRNCLPGITGFASKTRPF